MADYLSNFGVPIGGNDRNGMLMPKLKNRFRVLFYNFGGGGRTVDLSRQVQTCDRPKVNYEEQVVHSYNSKAYYAGKHEWQSISVSIRDDVTNAVSRLVGYQIQKQMNHFDQTVPLSGSSYKFQMDMEVLTGGNDSYGGGLELWNIDGCWLQDIQYDSGDYSATDPFMVTLTIRYDLATLTGGLFPVNPYFRSTSTIS